MRLIKDGQKAAMDNVFRNESGYAPNAAQSYFSEWHPLRHDWLDGLAQDIKAIVLTAQQCLMEGKYSEKELAGALLQIKEWKDKGIFYTNMGNVPGVVKREKLGSQLEIGAWVQFLSAHEKVNGFRHYEFIALALLQEILGLSELEVVAGKNEIGSSTQYLTLRIARLHIALLFLRMMDTLPYEQRDIFKEMASYLFQDNTPQS